MEGQQAVSVQPTHGGTVLGLPYELTLQIFAHSLPINDTSRLQRLQMLRLVNKECNELITELVVAHCISHLCKKVDALSSRISAQWNNQPNDAEGEILSTSFSAVAQASEELEFLRQKAEEKREARKTIFKMNIAAETKLLLLRACAFDSEFLGLKRLGERVKLESSRLAEPRGTPTRGRTDRWHNEDPLAVYPPMRPPRPFDPFSPSAPPIFGEPEPDHLPPPDWERDRNPPGLRDPSSPFHFPNPNPNPFNPPYGGGRGRGGGWPRFL